MYHTGNAKQASEFVTTSSYLINYIQRTYDKGADIAQALEDEKEFDFAPVAPKLKTEPVRARISQDTDATYAAAVANAEKANKQYEKQFEIEYLAHHERTTKYQENKSKAAALLWNQCTNTMRAKIASRTDYETKIKGDPIELKKAIKEHALNYESTQYRMKTIVDAMRNLVNLRQREDETTIDYTKRFKAAWDVFLSHVGKEIFFPRVVEGNKDYDDEVTKNLASTSQAVRDSAEKLLEAYKKECRDEFVSYLYLDNCDRSKYNHMIAGLESQHSLGNDQYPKTLVDAQSVLQNTPIDKEYKQKKKKKHDQKPEAKSQNNESEDTPKLSFAQLKQSCWCCGASNHKLGDCPHRHSKDKSKWHINKAKEMKQFNQMRTEINTIMNSQSAPAPAPATSEASNASTDTNSSARSATGLWQFFNFAGTDKDSALSDTIILDSGSSSHLFCNRNWLTGVQPSTRATNLQTNGGPIHLNQEGELKAFGTVPFNDQSLTNIFSLALLTDKYRVTFDNAVENAFIVHTPEGIVKFRRDKSDLYTHVPTQMKPKPTKKVTFADETVPTTFVQTVEENMQFHTPREVARAKKARNLLAALGFPTVADLKTAIAMNAIADLPVTTNDVVLAEKIFGPDLGSLKGKTTRKKPKPMVTDQIAIPQELYEARDTLELCVDIMYVNEMPFFTTITKAMYYRTAQYLQNRTKAKLYAALDEVLRIYNGNGFTISKMFADNEFRSIMDPVKDEMNLQTEYSAPQGHVPEAERNNRTLQERVRAAYHRLPYDALPKAIMKVLVSEAARKLNFFPNRHGISPHYSPRQIVHRTGLSYKHHCQYSLGSYVQAHDEPDPTNTQAPRTLDGIYLRPIDNGHEIYNLQTQSVIARRDLTVLPVTPTIIKAVNDIAAAEGQQGLRIKTKRGDIIYDSSWTAGVDYEEEDLQVSDDELSDSDSDDDSECSTTDDETDSDSDSEDEFDEEAELEAQEILHEPAFHTAGVPNTQTDPVQDEEEPDEEAPSDPVPTSTNQLRRSTRTRARPQILSPTTKGQSHGTRQNHLITDATDEDATETYDEDAARYVANFLQMAKNGGIKRNKREHPNKKGCHLITYSLQKGIKKFQRKGFDAAKGEMKQLHDRDCWTPIHVSSMTKTERAKALESLIFLVEKKDGKIKARHCANGSKQRDWMKSEEAMSPTVMTESVLLTAAIEAEEKRDVATFDIPNAFIQTEVDDTDEHGDRIVMKIRGAMIDMLIEIDERYEEFVTTENGKRILYVHIQRAIYGMLMSGLLFYKKFRASIEKIGYEVNPYDPCVANKIINGKQHTVSWHVDDLKSSHVDPKVNDDFHKWLQKEYGQVKEVTATRGKRHVYLGMTLDYSIEGEVKIDMVDYVKEMIEDFPAELTGKATSPAGEGLYNIAPGKRVSQDKSDAFHTMVAKALFLTMRSRPDIRQTVAFLCTRVKQPTSYDWIKLKRMMEFLHKTKEDCLILRNDGSRIVKWSMDAAFAVHADMKSHSGISMTMGKGSITSISKKQKLNTRSSTEAELVAVDDGIAQVLWTKRFLAAQDYHTEAHIILQDNESSIKLEKNGHKSVGQRSRHIKIRYFFITDLVQKGEVQIQYCPTDSMVADYQTKPLTGRKFRKFRAKIMNLPGQNPKTSTDS